MSPSVNSILLVDDSDADNYFHQLLLEQVGIARQIIACTSALKALDYLVAALEGEHPMPEIIFLDINIPSVDGWEFLNHYSRCLNKDQRTADIYMLSTSTDPKDRERANEHPLITGYLTKPLEKDWLGGLARDLEPT